MHCHSSCPCFPFQVVMCTRLVCPHAVAFISRMHPASSWWSWPPPGQRPFRGCFKTQRIETFAWESAVVAYSRVPCVVGNHLILLLGNFCSLVAPCMSNPTHRFSPPITPHTSQARDSSLERERAPSDPQRVPSTTITHSDHHHQPRAFRPLIPTAECVAWYVQL